MAYYHPCKNCAVEQSKCARRQAIKNSVAGLSVTSVKFRCKDRVSMFRAGQRVSFDWTYWEPSDFDDGSISNKLTFFGTVVAERRLKFIVRVDNNMGIAKDEDGENMDPNQVFKNKNLIITVKPSDMVAINEPDRHMCTSCLAYDLAEAKIRCQGWDYGAWDIYHPDGCLVDKAGLKKR